MFLTDCHVCGLRELRGARSIELLANLDRSANGMALVYRCTRCDARNVLTADGSSAPVTAADPTTQPATAPVAA
jgi:hypothetical protein